MVDLNLREEMDELFVEFGYYVLLQRTSRKIHCSCWNEQSQEGNSKCTKCNGTGWLIKIERHKTRKQDGANTPSKPNLNQQVEVGNVWTSSSVFYLRHDVNPQVGDIIYEVGWNNNRPINLINAHQISHVEPCRGNHGRIEYYRITARLNSVDRIFKESIIRNLNKTY